MSAADSHPDPAADRPPEHAEAEPDGEANIIEIFTFDPDEPQEPEDDAE